MLRGSLAVAALSRFPQEDSPPPLTVCNVIHIALELLPSEKIKGYYMHQDAYIVWERIA
jgi:hypothetical protein